MIAPASNPPFTTHEQTLTLGFSPCPNDTFIFDAMVHGKIDTEGLSFEPVIADVETLNKMALAGQLDITKLSFHTYLYVLQGYQLLNAGSALGRGCGPLLVAREKLSAEVLRKSVVAIPGKYTTASLLLSIACPEIKDRREMVFSDVVGAVASGQVDAGVIIHESRFTFRQQGLVELMDLGRYWEKRTKLPIPLGGVMARKSLGSEVVAKIDRIMKRSVQFSFDNPKSSDTFVRQHARELDDEVIQKHIDLYVTPFTLALEQEGWAAVEWLRNEASELQIIN